MVVSTHTCLLHATLKCVWLKKSKLLPKRLLNQKRKKFLKRSWRGKNCKWIEVKEELCKNALGTHFDFSKRKYMVSFSQTIICRLFIIFCVQNMIKVTNWTFILKLVKKWILIFCPESAVLQFHEFLIWFPMLHIVILLVGLALHPTLISSHVLQFSVFVVHLIFFELQVQHSYCWLATFWFSMQTTIQR